MLSMAPFYIQGLWPQGEGWKPWWRTVSSYVCPSRARTRMKGGRQLASGAKFKMGPKTSVIKI